MYAFLTFDKRATNALTSVIFSMSRGRGVQVGRGRHRGDEEEGGGRKLPGADGDQREGKQAQETRSKNVRLLKNPVHVRQKGLVLDDTWYLCGVSGTPGRLI